jgi:uncharacterized membrane protein YfcA
MFVYTILATTAVTCAALSVYGIASFGEGMMFQILLQVCNRLDSSTCDGDVATSTLTLSLSAIFTNPIQLWILRDFVDWDLGKNLAIFQAIGVTLGVRLLFLTQTLLLPHLLGIILFVAMLQKVMSDVCVAALDAGTVTENTPLKKYNFLSYYNYVTVWATGLTSGLLSGMYGTAGPPLIIFFSNVNLDKDVTRGTVSFCDNWMNFFRICSFLYYFITQGHVSRSEYANFSVQQLVIMYVAVTCGAIIGLSIGNYFSKFVNQYAFKYLVLFILAMGSILLTSVGLRSSEVVIVAICAFTIFIASNAAAYLFVRRRQASKVIGSSRVAVSYDKLPFFPEEDEGEVVEDKNNGFLDSNDYKHSEIEMN